MKAVILTLAVCLILTLVLEEVTALIVGVRRKFDLTVIFFTNTLTNPIVVFTGMALASYTQVPSYAYTIVLELIVLIVEALIYSKLLYTKKPSPFVLSLILNSASYFIGSTLASLILKAII